MALTFDIETVLAMVCTTGMIIAIAGPMLLAAADGVGEAWRERPRRRIFGPRRR